MAQRKRRMLMSLVRAVQNRDLDRTRTLLDQHSDLDINQPDSHDCTLLHWAVQEWSPEITRLLVERGAKPNKSGDRVGTPTPLCNAAGDGNLDAVRLLLDLGAAVNFSAGYGTVLHTACAYEQQEITEFLIGRGADVNAKDDEGWTPLHFAAQTWNADIVEMLLAHGADLAAADAEGKTALQVATEKRDEAVRKAQVVIDLVGTNAESSLSAQPEPR